jgi:hypothetical protein
VSAETGISKAKSSKRINKNETNVSDLDESFTPSNVPQEFVQAVAPFYRSAEAIYRLWYRVLIAHKRSQVGRPVEDMVDEVISAFKETVFAQKIGKVKSTFNGYFYRIIEAKMAVVKRREQSLFYWLS